MKIPILLIAAASGASAASVTFGFEGNNLTPTPSGSGFTSGNLVEDYVGSGASGAIFGGFTGSLAPTATTTVRAFRPSDAQNFGSITLTTEQFNSHASYFEFTLTPDSGQTLDFSSANFTFNLGSFVGVGSANPITNRAMIGYRISGTGDFAPVGSHIAVVADTYSASSNNWTGQSSFNTTANSFVIAQAAFDRDLSTLPSLNSGDSITFRVAFGDSGSTDIALTAASNVRGGYIDAISVNNFSVIPEPTALLLTALAPLALLRRRR